MGSGAARPKRDKLPHTVYVHDYIWGEEIYCSDSEASRVVTGFYKCKGRKLHNYVILTTNQDVIRLDYYDNSSILCRLEKPDGFTINYLTEYRVRRNYRVIDLFKLCEWIVRNKEFSIRKFNCRDFIRLLRWNICGC